jgi:carbon-monoxide dehydrogenase large subunit
MIPFGEPIRRKEDLRFVTGSGMYVEDVQLPGMLHAVFVRSSQAHAYLKSLNIERAQNIDGVVAVITGAEWPELSATLPELNGSVTTSSPYVDTMYSIPHHLFPKKICYVGEQIAIVIGTSIYAALDGAEAVEVEYEPLPAIVRWEDAIKTEAPRIHLGFDNIVGHLKHEIGDLENAFKSADLIHEARLDTQSVKSMALECRAVTAQWEEATETLNVWSTTQFMYMLRNTLAGILNKPAEAIRIMARDVGGGFGLKGVLHAEDVIVPLIANRLKRAIRWVETRSEHMTASNHSGNQTNFIRVAAKADGTILGMDVRIYKEIGAYDHFDMMLQINTINHMTTHYKVPNLRVEGWAVSTNTPPGSPFRGAGRVEAVFIMDRALDGIARKAGIDPIDLRLKNIIQPSDMPYRNGLIYRDGVPITYKDIDFPELLRTAKTKSEYSFWRQRQREVRRHGRFIGVGISSYVEGGGIGPCEGATISIDDRGKVYVKVGVNSQGQSHETTLAQICASTLGVSFDSIEVRSGDTGLMNIGFGTGASRVAINAGNAVYKASSTLRAKVAALAAAILNCPEEEIEISNGIVSVVGAQQNKLEVGELAKRAVRHRLMEDKGGPGLVATEFFYPKTVIWASGVNIAVIEIERETGAIKILKYVFVHDSGKAINPRIVEGQICGGFAQGLSMAIGEQLLYDEHGQLQTGSLMDYYVPRAADVPDIEIIHVTFPSAENPLGIKSVGESGPNSPPAAIAAAIEDALDGAICIDKLPISKEAIFHALNKL